MTAGLDGVGATALVIVFSDLDRQSESDTYRHLSTPTRVSSAHLVGAYLGAHSWYRLRKRLNR